MKNLEVVFRPEELGERKLEDKLVVVIDVLRASSTLVTALVEGSKDFIPVFSPEEAKEKARQFTREEVLLGGERKGKKIAGFDLGNSPREYQKEVVKDKIIIFSTTNGVRTLERVKGAFRIIIGSFLNAETISRYCAPFPGEVLLVCAGREGQFSLEDTVCAGMLISYLTKVYPLVEEIADTNLAAYLLYERFSSNLGELLQKCYHGKYLASIGLKEDLIFCAQANIFDIVPVFKDGIISIAAD